MKNCHWHSTHSLTHHQADQTNSLNLSKNVYRYYLWTGNVKTFKFKHFRMHSLWMVVSLDPEGSDWWFVTWSHLKYKTATKGNIQHMQLFMKCEFPSIISFIKRANHFIWKFKGVYLLFLCLDISYQPNGFRIIKIHIGLLSISYYISPILHIKAQHIF